MTFDTYRHLMGDRLDEAAANVYPTQRPVVKRVAQVIVVTCSPQSTWIRPTATLRR